VKQRSGNDANYYLLMIPRNLKTIQCIRTRREKMFVEYIKILNVRGADAGVNYYQVLLKIVVTASVGLALIYLAYKFLGKFGAIAVFIFEAIIFAIANDLVPFIDV
jgi:hypothetical protein